MNISHKILLSVLAVFALAFPSCVDLQFDEPPAADVCTLDATHTIADLKAMHTLGQTELISEDIVIRGVVVADDRTGNWYRSIEIQDETAGIQLRFGITDLYNNFPIGREIWVRCNGLELSDYNGLIQLGTIEEAVLDDFICRGDGGKDIQPTVVSMADLTTDMVSTLIQLDEVQFELADAGQPFADPVNLQAINRVLEDCNSQHTVLVRTSGYSDFAGQKTPVGSGTFIGILSVYGDEFQFLVRDPEELAMDNERCGPGSGTGLTSLQEDFQTGVNNEDIDFEGWLNLAVKGTRRWQAKEFDNNVYAQATAYNSSDAENECWLITPAIDLSEPRTLNFESAQAYWNHDGLSVWISTDFDGVNFDDATWTQLSCTLAGENDPYHEWVPSGAVDLSGFSGKGYIGFRYVGDPVNGTTSYRIDNVDIQ